jgi:hypothetical protein
MQRRRLRFPVLVLSVCSLFGLTACGDDDDDAATDASTTTEADSEVAEGATSVDIDMKEYAYVVSDDLVVGGTLNISNTGEEFHMMALGKFKPGKTLDDLRAAFSGPPDGGEEGAEGDTSTTAGDTTTSGVGNSDTSTTAAQGGEGEGEGEGEDPTAEIIDEVGLPGNLVGPGQSFELTVPGLEAGEYALMCFIPVEGDEEGTPHFAQGMIAQLNVVDGDSPAAPVPDATYRAVPGQPLEGPATLEAGKRVLAIETTDEGGDLEPVLLKPDEGKTFADIDRVFDETFSGESLPEGAADLVPGDLIAALFDFGETRTVYLGVELEPGTYELAAPDTDAEDGPDLPPERIVITVE